MNRSMFWNKHDHVWIISKKGRYSILGNCFFDTCFYCECGELYKSDFTNNFNEAGYTKEEYLKLLDNK